MEEDIVDEIFEKKRNIWKYNNSKYKVYKIDGKTIELRKIEKVPKVIERIKSLTCFLFPIRPYTIKVSDGGDIIQKEISVSIYETYCSGTKKFLNNGIEEDFFSVKSARKYYNKMSKKLEKMSDTSRKGD